MKLISEGRPTAPTVQVHRIQKVVAYWARHVDLRPAAARAVADYWEWVNADGRFTNDPLFHVVDAELENGTLSVRAEQTTYAHLLASSAGVEGVPLVRHLSGNALLTTRDNHLILGTMAQRTRHSGWLAPPGGGIKPTPGFHSVNVVAEIRREVKEELNFGREIKNLRPFVLCTGVHPDGFGLTYAGRVHLYDAEVEAKFKNASGEFESLAFVPVDLDGVAAIAAHPSNAYVPVIANELVVDRGLGCRANDPDALGYPMQP